MIDLDHWTWREQVDTDDGVRYFIIHWDPMVYEYPLDFIFPTMKEAMEWREEWISENQTCILTAENMATEDDCTMHGHEPTEAEDWVLMYVKATPYGKMPVG